MNEEAMSVRESTIWRPLAFCILAMVYSSPTSALSISIQSPADLFVTAVPFVDVGGTFDPMGGVGIGVAVNGIPAILGGGSFLVSAVPLSPGDNTITAVIGDSLGNSEFDSISVIHDEFFVPEPSAALLLACGLLGLGVRRR
jgi:hypothetical protein